MLPTGQLSFADGEFEKTVTVNIAGDTFVESNEVFTVRLSNPTGGAALGTEAAIGIILTDDVPLHDPQFTLSTSTEPFGLSPVGVRSASTFVDIDGDGDLDAFVGELDGNVNLFLNTGSPTAADFAAPLVNPFGLSDVGATSNPTFGDIDGDGDLDAFVGENGGDIFFFLNTGSASSAAFVGPQTNPFGLTNLGFASTPTLADIDGDGDLDAFVGEGFDGDLIFFRNTGSSTSVAFAGPETNPFGFSGVGFRSHPTFVDIDGDGDLDALVGHASGDVFLFLNTGSSTLAAFDAPETNPYGLNDLGTRSSPALVDIDADGDLDAFVGVDAGTFFFENVEVLVSVEPAAADQAEGNAGSTEFTFTVTREGDTAETGTVDFAVTGNTGLDAADFDGGVLPSGTVSFAAGETSQTLTVNVSGDFLAESNEVFTLRLSNPTGTGSVALRTESTTGTIQTDDEPAPEAQFTLSTSAAPFGLSDVGLRIAPTFVDIDGDGDLDAFVGEFEGNLNFFQNTGSSTSAAFAAPVSNSPFGLSDVGAVSAPTFADIDGDGDLDAFVGANSGNINFFENTGNSTAATFAALATNPFGLSDVGSLSTPTFVDIDGDGDLDTFVGESLGNVNFFVNTGNSTSAAFAAPVSNSPFGLSDVVAASVPTLADIDGDGDLDAFVGSGQGDIYFFENIGNSTAATFTAPAINPLGLSDVGNRSKPTLVDIDGDGDFDAFVGEFDGNVYFFENIAPLTEISIAAGADKAEGDSGTTAFTFTVTRAGNASDAGTVDYAVTGNTGLDGLDFVGGVLPSGTVSFAAGETSHTLTIEVSGDFLAESDEVFTVRLSNPIGTVQVELGTESAIGTIQTDDTPVADAQFTASPSIAPFGLSAVAVYSTPIFVDIDGDGDLDAFVGDRYGGVYFFANTGSSTSPAFAVPVTNSPFGLSNVGLRNSPAFGDIDGDGDLDAFVGEVNGNVYFFANTGSSSAAAFAAPVTDSPFGLSDVGVLNTPTFADIDGDGDLDALVGEVNAEAHFFENTGSSTSAAFAAPVSNLPFGLDLNGSRSAPTLADIDGDGDLDAFVGRTDGNVDFFENTGNSTAPAFAARVANAFVDVGQRSVPTFADIDGDGDLDAFVGEYDGYVNFFENVAPLVEVSIGVLDADKAEGDGGVTAFTFAVTRAGNVTDTGTVDYAVTGNTGLDGSDFDGGILPFGTVSFAAGETGQTVTVNVSGDFLAEPDEVFTVRLSNPTGTGSAGLGTESAIGTIQTDDGSPPEAQFTLSTSAAPFGLSNVGIANVPTFVDIDGDGDLDAFVGERYGTTYFFRNTGSPTAPAFSLSTDPTPFGLIDLQGNSIPKLVDIDGDGDLDALVGERAGGFYVFENTGSSTSPAFAAPETDSPFGLTDVAFRSAPTFVDIDGDGDLDAFVGEDAGYVTYFENTGSSTSPAFAAPETGSPFGLSDVGLNSNPTFVDVDGDGDLDAFVGERDGIVNFFENTGSSTGAAFAPPVINPLGFSDIGSLSAPTFVDIDGDGDLDAFVGEQSGNVNFFENVTPPNKVSITPATTDQSEGDAGTTAFTFTVTRTGFVDDAGTVDYAVTGNTGLDGSDFVGGALPSGTVSFAAGETSQTLTIEVSGDFQAESDEVFTVRLSNPVATQLTSPDPESAIGTIRTDDGPVPNPQFALSTSVTPFGLSDVGQYSSPTFVDIDGDGDLDAFVGERYGEVYFFENTGSSTAAAFDAPDISPFGLSDLGNRNSPAFADIDGDGDLDAFVGVNPGYVNFFENTGSSTAAAFATPVTDAPFGLSDVGGLTTPTLVDIDGDGDLDAFVGEFEENLNFFENTGSSTSAAFAGPVTNAPFGLSGVTYRNAPTFLDIDGDGDLDAFVGGDDGGAVDGDFVLFFENTGSSTSAAFAVPVTDSPFGITNVGKREVPTFADIDGDGDFDAFVGEYDGNLNFFENVAPPVEVSIAADAADQSEGDAGSTAFTFTVTRLGNAAGTAVDYAVTGNTGLNASDFVGGVLPSGTVSFAAGETSQTLTVSVSGDRQVESDEVFTVRLSNPTGTVQVALGAEAVIGTIRADDVPAADFQFALANSAAPFGLSAVGTRSTPAFADIDGDGDLDAFLGASQGTISFFANTGSSTSPAFAAPVTDAPFGLSDVGDRSAPAFADIDGDGDLDAFVGEQGGSVYFFENTGSATSAAFAAPVTDSPAGLSGVIGDSTPALVDIDGDGDLDAFVGASDGNVYFFENTGSATSAAFAVPVTGSPFGLSNVGSDNAPAFADVDGDGDLDAFVGEYDGNLNFFENTGSSTSAAFAAPVTSAPFGLSDVGDRSTPALVDIDGDGDLDAFVGENGGSLEFFENQQVRFSIDALAADQAEGDSGTTAFTFTLSRIGNTGDVGTVDYAVTGNTGLDASDFDGGSLPSGTVSFAAGETSQTLTVDVSGDIQVESDEVFTVRLSNPTGTVSVGLSTDSAIGTIQADDVPVVAAQFTLSTSGAPFGLSDVGNDSAPAFADIDGDGDLDAFVGQASGGLINFFKNNGSATSAAFAVPVFNSYGLTGVGFRSTPTFADIDGDGDLDAFVGSVYGRTDFFENTGNSSLAAFSAPVTNAPFGLSIVNQRSAPTLVDIDGDGDLDAFVGETGGFLHFFKNTGSPTSAAFDTPVTNPFGLSTVGLDAKATFADMDGDGDLDVFVGEFLYGNVFFFENTGSSVSAAFGAGSSSQLSIVGQRVAPTLVDIDGDGDLDGFVGEYAGNVNFFENVAPQVELSIDPLVADQAEGDSGTTAFTFTVTRTGNTTESGTVDYAVTGNTGLDASDFDGGSLPSGTVSFAAGETSQTVTVDVSGDTRVESDEVFTVRLSNPSADGALGDESAIGTIRADDAAVGEAVFTLSTDGSPFGLSSVGGRSAPTFADIDGDGDLDAFVGKGNGTISLFDNTGSASAAAFAAPVAVLGDVGDYSAPTLADIDGDGDLDAFVGGGDGNLHFFENTGNASSPAFAPVTVSPFGLSGVGASSTPVLADIDGDGDLDALVGKSDGNLNFFENTGSSTSAAFAAPDTDSPFGLSGVGSNATPTLVDIDGDGDLDAFVGESDGTVDFFENTGSSSSAAFATPVTVSPFGLSGAGSNATPTLVDIDGDGDLDAFVGESGGSLEFFENVAPPAAISIAALSADKTEGDTATTAFTFTLTRAGDPTDVHTVDFSVLGSGGDSADTADFGGAFPSGTVTFASGETTKALTIDVTGDDAVEPDEGFTVTLSNPSNGVALDTDSALGSIRNDDTELSVSALDADQLEGDSGTTPFTFTVTRIGDASGANTVDFSVLGAGGDAADADDFGGAFPSGTVTFASGETTRTLTIDVSGDDVVEPDEGFTVMLANPSGEATLGTDSVPGNIQTDDTKISVSSLAADKVEGDAGATPFTFTVTRTGDTSGTSTVDFSVLGSGGNLADPDDFGGALPSGTVTFTAGVTSQVVTIDVSGDDSGEPDEGFTVTLSSPSPGVTLDIDSAPGTIRNDDTEFSVFGTDADKVEGDSAATSFTFSVTRSGDVTEAGTVDYAVTGSGAAPADATDFPGGVLPSGTVAFAAGQTTQTLTVEVSGDTAPEVNEQFTVTLSNPSANATLGTDTATGTLVTDDGQVFELSSATAPLGLTAVGLESRVTLGDLDGDGDLDALVGDATGIMSYFENTGSATAPAYVPVGGTAPFGLPDTGSFSAPALGDLDGDGDLDLLVGVEHRGCEQCGVRTGGG